MAWAVRIESNHKLAEGINKICQLPMLKEDDKINEVTVEVIGDPRARTGNCYGCGQVGHFFEDCTNPDKFEYRKENHPYPPNKGSAMDWHLNISAHSETAGLMGTIYRNKERRREDYSENTKRLLNSMRNCKHPHKNQ